jgi:hypothetical protein
VLVNLGRSETPDLDLLDRGIWGQVRHWQSLGWPHWNRGTIRPTAAARPVGLLRIDTKQDWASGVVRPPAADNALGSAGGFPLPLPDGRGHA